MISACIFDLEGVIFDAESCFQDLMKGGAFETESDAERFLERVNGLSPDDLKDGVLIFVKELKNKGLNLAAVSAFPHLRKIMNRLQITHYFHVLVEQGMVENSVEHGPELYAQAALDLGVSVENTLVFTASAPGIRAATEAGCWVVGVGLGADLAGADLVIPSLEKVRFLKIISAIGEEEE